MVWIGISWSGSESHGLDRNIMVWIGISWSGSGYAVGCNAPLDKLIVAFFYEVTC